MPAEVNNRFLLLYGSQTGQAETIAAEIAEKAGNHGLHADLHCLSMTEKKFFIERERCVVIVTSTTGDGEPPDKALKFVRRLRKKTLPDTYLSHLNYAVLGLGDSNYTNFCNCGKTMDRRFKELGASTFYTAGWADDAVGLEVEVEPWMDGLWAALRSFLELPLLDTNCDSHSSEQIPLHTENQIVILDNSDNQSVTVNNNENQSVITDLDCVTCVNDSNDHKGCDNDVRTPILPYDSIVSQAENQNQSSNNDLNVINSSSNEVTSNKSSLNVDDKSLVTVSKDSQSSAKLDDLEVQTSTVSISDSHITSPDKEGERVEAVTGVRVCIPRLSDSSITVPALPPPYLHIDYHPQLTLNVSDLPYQNDCSLPSAASPVTMATVVSMATMTSQDAVKKTMCVTLDISGTDINYQPGDSFSIICPNDTAEVDMLLKRLNVHQEADYPYKLSVISDTKKKNASIPKHVPETATLRHLFTTCLDIREPPKKALLRTLCEYTTDEGEKRQLQELCSKQGASLYSQYVRGAGLSILDILYTFPSCHPPVPSLIEQLGRLQPRPYSVCTSPLVDTNTLACVFNVMDMPCCQERSYDRKGVCTGWLEGLSQGQGSDSRHKGLNPNPMDNTGDIVAELNNLNIAAELKIPIFMRTNNNFHLPDDLTVPLILIGPGTGVAPFIGYLDHLTALHQSQPSIQYGEVWLLYGCRHRDRDYLFREKLEQYKSCSIITKLLVSYSRDETSDPAICYVQDNIRQHGHDMVQLIDNQEAIVYVCGDATNMAKDVNEAFIDVFAKEKGITVDEGRKLMMKLRLDKRYKEDVWT